MIFCKCCHQFTLYQTYNHATTTAVKSELSFSLSPCLSISAQEKLMDRKRTLLYSHPITTIIIGLVSHVCNRNSTDGIFFLSSPSIFHSFAFLSFSIATMQTVPLPLCIRSQQLKTDFYTVQCTVVHSKRMCVTFEYQRNNLMNRGVFSVIMK